MAKGKWIQGTSPAAPVSTAAREALRARLRTVAYYLPLATFKSDRDVEYVHQVRVSTRRAVALVRIFRSLLSNRDADWLDRKLKKIRRAAGEARDLDVLGRRIAEWVESRPSSARAALLYRVERFRDRAQPPVRKVHKKMARQHFDRRIDKIVDRVRWREEGPEPSFGASAAGCLRNRGRAVFRGRCRRQQPIWRRCTVSASRPSTCATRWRCSRRPLVRDFAPSFIPASKRCRRDWERFTTTPRRLSDFKPGFANGDDGPEVDALRELAEIERGNLATTRQNFIRWWTPERAAELRQQFDQALAAQAAPPGEKSA